MAKYLLLKHYRGGPDPVVDFGRWTSGRRRRSTRTSSTCADFAAKLEGTGEYVDGQALSPGGHVRPLRRRGPAAGHRRPVRRDQGPDRRLDGDRRGHLRAGRSSWPASSRPRPARMASRSTNGSSCGPFLTAPPTVTE